MRRTKLLIFLSVTVTFSLSAYEYQTVYSNRIALYANSTGQIKSMQIDSVRYHQDSILYPLKNIQKLDMNCYTPFGSSWLGNKIIVKSGLNYFFNQNNDTIKIKTDAKLNESWILYKGTDIIVEAYVYSHTILTVLGVKDSVKTIRLLAYGFGVSSLKYEHGEILLSKKFGLIKTYNFLAFPSYEPLSPYKNKLEVHTLVGMTNPNVGVQNLKWFDVYDFQPGDEIHIMYGSTPSLGSLPTKLLSKKETITKYITRQDYSDSIKYTEEIKQQTNGVDYVHYTTSVVVRQNNAFNTYAEIPIFRDDNQANKYTMSVGNFIIKSEPSVYNQIHKANDACWTLLIADGCFATNSYYKGLGGPYYFCTGIMGDYEENSLVYYKKGSITWGTPLVITGISQPKTNQEIAVYPNPTTGKLSIKSELQTGGCIFELMDVRGIVVLKTAIVAGTNFLDIGSFSNGLYMYRLINNGEVLKSGKIIKM